MIKSTNKQASQIYGGTSGVNQESQKPMTRAGTQGRQKRPDIDYQIVNVRKSKAHATYQQAHAAIAHAEMSHGGAGVSFSRDLSKFKKRKVNQQPKLPQFGQHHTQGAMVSRGNDSQGFKGRQRHLPIYHGKQGRGDPLGLDESMQLIDGEYNLTPANRHSSGVSEQAARTHLTFNDVGSPSGFIPMSTKAGATGPASPSKLDTRSLRSIRAQRNNLNVISSAAFNSAGVNQLGGATSKLQGLRRNQEPDSGPGMSRTGAEFAKNFQDYHTAKSPGSQVPQIGQISDEQKQQLERDLELYESYLRMNQESALSLERRNELNPTISKQAAQNNTQILAGVLSQMGLRTGASGSNASARPGPTGQSSILKKKKLLGNQFINDRSCQSQRKFLGGGERARGSLSPRRSYQQLQKGGMHRFAVQEFHPAATTTKFDYYEDVHLRQLDEAIGELSHDDDEHVARRLVATAAPRGQGLDARPTHQLAASDDGQNLTTNQSNLDMSGLHHHSRNVEQVSPFHIQKSATTTNYAPPREFDHEDDWRESNKRLADRSSPDGNVDKRSEAGVKIGNVDSNQVDDRGSETEHLVLPDISQQSLNHNNSVGNLSSNQINATRIEEPSSNVVTNKCKSQADNRRKVLPTMISHTASQAIIKSRASLGVANQQRMFVNQQQQAKLASRKSLEPGHQQAQRAMEQQHASDSDDAFVVIKQNEMNHPEQSYMQMNAGTTPAKNVNDSSKVSSHMNSSRGKNTGRGVRHSAHKPRNIEALLYNSQPQQYFNDQLLNKFIDEEIERMSRLKGIDQMNTQTQQLGRARAAGQGSQQFSRMQASGPLADDLLLLDHQPSMPQMQPSQSHSTSKIGGRKQKKNDQSVRMKRTVAGTVNVDKKRSKKIPAAELQQLYNTNIEMSRSLSSMDKSKRDSLSSGRHRPSSKATNASQVNYRTQSKTSQGNVKPLRPTSKSRSSSKLLHSQTASQKQQTQSSIQPQQVINAPIEKHEHHHYHIDVNIEQVNNILINCGIVPPPGQLKHENENQSSNISDTHTNQQQQSFPADTASSLQRQEQAAQRKPQSRGGQKRNRSMAKQQQPTTYKSALRDAGKQYHAPLTRPDAFISPVTGPRSPQSPSQQQTRRKPSKNAIRQASGSQSNIGTGKLLNVGFTLSQVQQPNSEVNSGHAGSRQVKMQSRHDRLQKTVANRSGPHGHLTNAAKRNMIQAMSGEPRRPPELPQQKSLSDFIEEMYLQHELQGAARQEQNPLNHHYSKGKSRGRIQILATSGVPEPVTVNSTTNNTIMSKAKVDEAATEKQRAVQRDNAYGQMTEAPSRQMDQNTKIGSQERPLISDQPQLVLAKNAVNFANQTQVEDQTPTSPMADSKKEEMKDKLALSPPTNFEAKKLSSQLRQPTKVATSAAMRQSSQHSFQRVPRAAGTFQHHRPNQLQTNLGNNLTVNQARKAERPTGSGIAPKRDGAANVRSSAAGVAGINSTNNSVAQSNLPPRKGSSRHSRAESKRGPLVLRSDEAYAEYSSFKTAEKRHSHGRAKEINDLIVLGEQHEATETGADNKVLSQSISKINILQTKEPATAMPRPRNRSPLRVPERELNNQSSVALFLPNFCAGEREHAAPVVKPTIGDFDLHEVVGIGNFGKVMRAFNRVEQRECALKILQKDNIAQMKHVDHVVNEREILKFLTELQPPIRDTASQLHQHSSSSSLRATNSQSKLGVSANPCPFLTRFYSSFQDENHLYLELEYIKGCTLLSQIASGNSGIQQNYAFYAAETLLTLQYLHQYKIVYRDLKPENILLSMKMKGHIKLVDFGFSKSLRQIGKTHTNCGTPVYIAPEIIQGIGHGFEVDVWSLGILICEMASGQTPFQAESTKAVYEKICMCQPVYNRKVPNIVRDLLDKIFVTDPGMRLTFDEMKKHAVFKDFDFSVAMIDRIRGPAPWVPEEDLLEELADRDSQTGEPKLKKRGFFADVMAAGGGETQKRLSFDDDHFKKFLRENKERKADTFLGGLQTEDMSPKRRRQNPLGDFKFKRINELF